MNKKVCAFAVDEKTQIALTLGTAQSFLILPDKQIPAKGSIPVLLRKNDVTHLFCGKIGMCLLSLLEGQGVTVIPGCSGIPETILKDWESGSLKRETGYLCSENGRSCGNCPGRF